MFDVLCARCKSIQIYFLTFSARFILFSIIYFLKFFSFQLFVYLLSLTSTIPLYLISISDIPIINLSPTFISLLPVSANRTSAEIEHNTQTRSPPLPVNQFKDSPVHRTHAPTPPTQQHLQVTITCKLYTIVHI